MTTRSATACFCVLAAAAALAGCSSLHRNATAARLVGADAPQITVPSAVPAAVAAMFACRDSDTEIESITWQNSNGALAGNDVDDKLSGDPPDESLSSQDVAFTGSISGSAVSLTVRALGASETIIGTISGDRMTLNEPQQDGSVAAVACTSTTPGEWNQLVSGLKQAAASVNAAENQRESEQAQQEKITSEQANLAEDVSTLVSDAKELAADTSVHDAVAQVQQAWTTEQNTWTQGRKTGECGDGSLSYDAAVVASDDGDVEASAADVDGSVDSLTNEIGADGSSGVGYDISQVEGDVTGLEALGVAPAGQASADAAVTSGRAAQAEATRQISRAKSEANNISAAAGRLASKADAYATSECG